VRGARPGGGRVERLGGGDGERRAGGGRGRGGRGRRDGEEGEEAGESQAEATPVPMREGDPRAQFKQILGTLSGSLKAVLLDDTGKTVQGELAVRELADTLKGSKDGVHAVVFDGVITQRLLDIAAEKKIATVVGVKMGNVTKVPDTVEILTRDDLQ
jgi:DNA primase